MYRVYWIAWRFLLALTVLMVGLDQAPLSRAVFVVLMLMAMLIKACLVGVIFMHLRAALSGGNASSPITADTKYD